MDLLRAGEFWASASALFWAVAVILFKKAGEEIPPLALNLFKGAVAILFFGLVFATGFAGPAPDWPPRTWLLLALSGFVGITLADTLFFMALNRLGAGLNAVVDCLYFPIFALLAAVFLGERLGLWGLVGGVMVVGAILLGSGVRPLPGTSRRDIVVGTMLGTAGMILVASSVVFFREIIDREPVFWTALWRLVAGTAAIVPLVMLRPERKRLAALARPSRRWRYALPASICGGALAMWAWLAGFKLLPGNLSRAAVLNQMAAVYIFILAIVVLREPATKRRICAIVLAFGGATLVLLTRP